MKIALVHEEYPLTSNFGGIATYQKNLAESLAKKGEFVTVICRTNIPMETLVKFDGHLVIIPIYIQDYDLYNLDHNKLFRMRIGTILRQLESDRKIDIVETPDWGANCIYYQRSFSRKVPIVVKLHTPLFVWEKYNNFNFSQDYRKLIMCWEKEQIQNADSVVSCTENLSDIVRDKYNLSHRKVTVIPNPIKMDTIRNNQYSYHANRLMFVGSLEERKGVIEYAKSLHNHSEFFKDFELKFIGQDTKRNYKQESTQQLIIGLTQKDQLRIEFYGHLNHDEVLRKMQYDADIIIVPSLYDNLPYVILEAMNLGKPIIASNRGGIPEIITNGKNGILIDPQIGQQYVAAVRKLETFQVRKKIGMCAQNSMNRYSIDEIYHRTIENYSKTINNLRDLK